MKKLYTLFFISVIASGLTHAQAPLFFSEYIEGSSNNKALEIYNPTASAVDLSMYQIAQASNGGGWQYYDEFASGASIAAGDVYVVANGSSVADILDVTDETMTYPVYFNGDDARAIVYITATDTTFLDVIGLESPDPGSGWEVAGVSNATQNHTLVRKSYLEQGNTDWAASAGTDEEDSEWIVYDQDEFTYLGTHTYLPLITSITLEGAGGATTIDTDKGTLQIEATILPAESAGQELDWEVDDPALASVNSAGLLSAINDGTVKVTATAKDGSGVSGSLDIIISNQVSIIPVNAITVTGTGDATTITDNGGTLQMLADVVPADATDATYTWSVDDELIATIDVNGLLSAVNNGTVTVSATANDGYGAVGTLDITVSGQYVEVADLTELRTMDASDETTVYKIAGELVLTFQQDYRHKKYLQEDDAGIEIDDDGQIITTTYDIGDGISGLMGTLNDYYGHLQLVPVADPGAASSTGNDITPLVVTTTQLKTDHITYQSRLVKLESVVIPDADGSLTFANGDSYDLADPNDTIPLKVHFYSTDLAGTVVPDSANVTGIVIWDWSKSRIAPRSAADVEELLVYVPSDDASITDLLVDGVSVPGFTSPQLSYFVSLHDTTTIIPTVTVVTGHDSAVVTVTDAVNLDGTEAERTTTVLITAEDMVATKSYTVTFSLAVGIGNQREASIEIFPVPADGQLFVNSDEALSEIRVISITGSTVMMVELSGEKSTELNISNLGSGVYFLQLSGKDSTQVLRFVKN